MAEGGRQSGIVQCTAASADSLQELLSGFFGWFSEVQVKKESGEKLYDKLRKWKYYFAECETETSESRLDPHKTASEYR